MRVACRAAALLAAVAGCDASWTIDDGALASEPTDGRLVITRFADGACTDEAVYWAEAKSAEPPAPLDLAAGDYCFYAYRWDDTCSAASLGWGVAENVSLPSSSAIVTTLEPGCEGPCLSACTPPAQLWPQEADFLRREDVTFRVAIPPRPGSEHPRPDRFVVRVQPCAGEACGKRDDPLEGAGETPAIRVAEDETSWTVPLSSVPGLTPSGRLAWQVEACFGARCIRSPSRYFHAGRSRRDVDGDALDDVTVGDTLSGKAYFYRTGPGGSHAQRLDEVCTDDGTGIVFDSVGDVNDDDRGQLALSRRGCSEVTFFIADPGTGYLEADRSVGVDGRVSGISAGGDVDADGWLDVLVATTSSVQRLGRDGDAIPLEGPPSARAGRRPIAGGADFDADGFSDFAVLGPTGPVLCFGAASAATDALDCHSLPLSDFVADGASIRFATDANGDAFADLVIGEAQGTEAVWVVLGNEARTYAPLEVGPFDPRGSLATGDVNEDGLSDLLVGRPGSNQVDVYIGVAGDQPYPVEAITVTDQRTVPPVPNVVTDMGRAVVAAGGRQGAQRYDFGLARLMAYAGGTIPEVRLYEWSDRLGPRPSVTITAPDLTSTSAISLGFGGEL